MKIGQVVTDDGPRIVVSHEGKHYDLGEITGEDLENSGKSFFFLVQKNLEKTRDFISSGKLEQMDEISPKSFLIPVPHVNQVRDFYAFEEHVRNARKKRGLEVPPEWYDFPAYYYSGNSSLYPSDSEIARPKFTSELDFELELAVIIGKEGKDISKSDAMDHAFGFVLMNDWSARDQQRKEMSIGLGPSKSKDFATSFGRYVVTADEVLSLMDGNSKIDSEVSVIVNGREVTRNNLNTMYWTFPHLISWASTDVTLRPGDILMSGTVGRGCILELGPEEVEWLKPGDVVKFESSAFGELNSRIV